MVAFHPTSISFFRAMHESMYCTYVPLLVPVCVDPSIPAMHTDACVSIGLFPRANVNALCLVPVAGPDHDLTRRPRWRKGAGIQIRLRSVSKPYHVYYETTSEVVQ